MNLKEAAKEVIRIRWMKKEELLQEGYTYNENNSATPYEKDGVSFGTDKEVRGHGLAAQGPDFFITGSPYTAYEGQFEGWFIQEGKTTKCRYNPEYAIFSFKNNEDIDAFLMTNKHK